MEKIKDKLNNLNNFSIKVIKLIDISSNLIKLIYIKIKEICKRNFNYKR